MNRHQHNVISSGADLKATLARYSPANRNQVKWGFLRDRKTYTGATGHDVISFFDEKNDEFNTVKTPGRPLPSDTAMIVHAVSIRLISGIAPARAGAGILPLIANDVVAFSNRGVLAIKVNQDDVLEDGPLGNFPADNFVAADIAYVDTFTADDDKAGVVELVRVVGKPYPLEPFTLMPDQNLSLKLVWPNGKLALPSGQDAAVEVRLWGEKFLIRS